MSRERSNRISIICLVITFLFVLACVVACKPEGTVGDGGPLHSDDDTGRFVQISRQCVGSGLCTSIRVVCDTETGLEYGLTFEGSLVPLGTPCEKAR